MKYEPPFKDEPPRYDHDCDICWYLGRYRKWDLYVCPLRPTVIARFGNDGPDYASSLAFAEDREDGLLPGYKPLVVALDRFRESFAFVNDRSPSETRKRFEAEEARWMEN